MQFSGPAKCIAFLCLSILLLQSVVFHAGSTGDDVFAVVRTSTERWLAEWDNLQNVLHLHTDDWWWWQPFGGLRGSRLRRQRHRALAYFFSPKPPSTTDAPTESPTDPPTDPPARPSTPPPTVGVVAKKTSNPQSLGLSQSPLTLKPVALHSSAPEPLSSAPAPLSSSFSPYSTITPSLEKRQPDLEIHQEENEEESTQEPSYTDEFGEDDDESTQEESLVTTSPPTIPSTQLGIHQQDLSKQPFSEATTVNPSNSSSSSIAPTRKPGFGKTVHPGGATVLPGPTINGYSPPPASPETQYPVVTPSEGYESSIVPGQIAEYPDLSPPITQLPTNNDPFEGYQVPVLVQESLYPEASTRPWPSATQLPVVVTPLSTPPASIVPGKKPGYLPATEIPGQSEQMTEQPVAVPETENFVQTQEPELQYEPVPGQLDALNQATTTSVPVSVATTPSPTVETTPKMESTQQSTTAEVEPIPAVPTSQKETEEPVLEPSQTKAAEEVSEPSTQASTSAPVSNEWNNPSDEVEEMEDLEKEEEELEEELAEEEREVRRIGGFGVFLAIVAMIFTAHQMSENPDGIYASCCRLIITVSGCAFKAVLMPFRSAVGGHRGSYGHLPVPSMEYGYRDPYRPGASSMELS